MLNCDESFHFIYIFAAILENITAIALDIFFPSRLLIDNLTLSMLEKFIYIFACKSQIAI